MTARCANVQEDPSNGESRVKRSYSIMIAGAIIIVAGIAIVIPSILTIYSALTSFSINDVARIMLAEVAGWFGVSVDVPEPVSRLPIVLSTAGLVVSPILLVNGTIAIIAGSILALTDRRKQRKEAAIH